MDVWECLSEIDHGMTMIDIDLMEWRGHLDMAALAGVGMDIYVDERPVEEAKVTVEKEPELHMRFNGKWLPVGYKYDAGEKEVPLVRYEGNERIEVGTAKINENGTIDAIVNHENAGFLALPDPSEYSFFTDPESLPKKKWWASRVDLEEIRKENARLLREEMFNSENRIEKNNKE